jgi:chromosome segregation ATPase
VSNPAGNGGRPDQEAFAELERAIDVALDRLAQIAGRLHAAEAKSDELGEVVKRFTGDDADGQRILTRLGRLEEENADLRARLAEGRAGIDRLLAKIQFLENQQ